MSVRESFVETFSEEQADALEAAATKHENGVHDNRGSDPFKWAVCIALGYQCVEIDRYRDYHGITIDWQEFRQWVIDHASLGTHDGDVDYLAALTGVYDDFIAKEVQR